MKQLTITHTHNATLIGDRNVGHTIESSECEYLHNSIDAGSRNIWITHDQTTNLIIIKDDGHGMSTEAEVGDYFNVGHKTGNANINSIGGYGFGAYYASIYLAQKIVLTSKKAGEKKFVKATWEPDRRTDPKKFHFDTHTCPVNEINGSYTKIELHIVDINRERLESIGWEEFSNQNSNLYKKYFANMKVRFRDQILTGTNIIIDGVFLKTDADPLFLDNSDVELWPGNGTVNIDYNGVMVPITFTGVSLLNVKETIENFDSQKGGRKQDLQGIFLNLCPQSKESGVLLTLGGTWAEVNDRNPRKTHARLKITIDERLKALFGISTIKNKPDMKFPTHSGDPNVKIIVDKVREYLSWVDRKYTTKPKRAKKTNTNTNTILSEIANKIKTIDTGHITPIEAMNLLNDLKSKLIGDRTSPNNHPVTT